MKSFGLPLVCLWVWLLNGPTLEAQAPYLQPGDHIAFLGGAGPALRAYENWIETFVLTRFPESNMLFSRPVWAGDGAARESSREMPTIAVGSAPVSVASIRAAYPQARVTFVRLAPAGGTSGGGRDVDGVLDVDAAGALRSTAEKVRAFDAAQAAILTAPSGEVSQLLIAQAVLQAWRAPALVTSVEIDALRGAVTRAENTTVRDLENGRVIAWTQDDRTTPIAVDFTDPAVAVAIRCSEFGRLLDNQSLRIRGMAAESYSLTIDGEIVGVFRRDVLDAGLNLAILPTPMWKQSMGVHALTLEHNELRESRRRLMGAAPAERQSAAWKASVEALDVAEADLVDRQRALAKPRTHDYELVPVDH